MSLTVKPRAQDKFAAIWLKDTCVVTRVSGFGTGLTPFTVASGAKYKHEASQSSNLAPVDGGFKAAVEHRLKFHVNQDINPEDIITDSVSGQRFEIGADVSGSFMFLRTFTAIEIQDSS